MHDDNKTHCAHRPLRLSMSLLALGLLPVMAAMGAGKLSADLQSLSPSASVDVIVQFTTPPSAADLSKVAQQGGRLKAKFRHIPAAAFTVPAAALKGMAADARVKYVSRDRKLAGALEFAEPAVGAQIALQYGWDGSGVGVAVIDSGIASDHPDLKTRVVYAESFVPDDSSTDDVYGHGTHVSGIVGGNGSASSGPSFVYTFRGIAPKANLINLRVLDNHGQGTDSAVIAALDRAIELKATYGIRVVNLSLGRNVYENYTLDPLCQAVERAWQSGLVVVVAAGNSGRDNSMGTQGYSTIASPGNDPYVITVGAMKDMSTAARGDDLIASYSSKGPTLLDQVVKPDLVAPGNGIVSALASNSTIRQLYPDNVVPVSYYKSGNVPKLEFLFPAQWDEHGCPDGQRSRRAAFAAGLTDARPGEGAADEDGWKEFPSHQLLCGPCHRHKLQEHVRSVHGGSGLSRRLGGVEQPRVG